MSLIEIKDFNALIDSKPFFDQLVTGKLEENYREIMIFIAAKQRKAIIYFSLDLLIVTKQYKQ